MLPYPLSITRVLIMNIIRIVACLSAALFAAALSAQTCRDSITASTPTSRFSISDNTIIDNTTNLEWQRCRLGTTWDDSANGCPDDGVSDNDTYTWKQALEAAASNEFNGASDWRLPNIKELNSIVEEACYNPAINLELFPDTPSDSFWSSSPYANYSLNTWIVSFFFGIGYYVDRSNSSYVRLVRSRP